jgi:hypothetical protein
MTLPNSIVDGEEGNMDTKLFTLISTRVRHFKAIITHIASSDFEFVKLKFLQCSNLQRILRNT